MQTHPFSSTMTTAMLLYLGECCVAPLGETCVGILCTCVGSRCILVVSLNILVGSRLICVTSRRKFVASLFIVASLKIRECFMRNFIYIVFCFTELANRLCIFARSTFLIFSLCINVKHFVVFLGMKEKQCC